MACAQFTANMGVDEEQRAEQIAQQRIDDQLNEFYREIGVRTNTPPNTLRHRQEGVGDTGWEAPPDPRMNPIQRGGPFVMPTVMRRRDV